MKSRTTDRFWKCDDELPVEIRHLPQEHRRDAFLESEYPDYPTDDIDCADQPCYPVVVRKNEISGFLITGGPMLVQAKTAQMGRIVTQVRLTNFTDPSKTLAVSALVDTGSAYITLPNAWRESLGDVEQLGEVEVERADQSVRKGSVCGPVRVRIGEFRPIAAEVLFIDMTPDDDGEYEPLVGYIALEQAGAAVDMLGHRLVHVKRVDLK